MTMSKLWTLAGFGLFVPAVALAQAPTSSAQQQPSNSQKMYEDVEIMRRILNRKLGSWPNLISLNTNCAVCHVVSGNFIRNSEGKFVDITGGNNLVGGASMDQVGTGTSLGVASANFDQELLDVFVANDPHGFHSSPTNIEGVYLKGQGAVYTLTLPNPLRSRPLATRKTSSKPLTDWEQARRAIRGDQAQPKESTPAKESNESGIFAELEKSGHLGLTETILKILAENGHNFSQLKEDEKITVAVTFREPSRMSGSQSQTGTQAGNSLNAWGSPGQESPTTWEGQIQRGGDLGFSGGGGMAAKMQGGAGGGAQSGGGIGGFSGGTAGMKLGSAGGGGEMAAKGGGGGGLPTPASVRDFELLGDRLVKQGKIQEAIRAFQRALNLDPPAKQAADLYRKIAQADLVIEDIAAAKKALEMADQNLKEAAEPTKASSNAGKPTLHSCLPSKLIISAPKRLLDQVAAGKIPYADFRRQATIDFFGFSPSTQPAPKAGN